MEKRDEELILTLVDKDPELKKHYDEHVEFESPARTAWAARGT
jgi:hypothetical protein